MFEIAKKFYLQNFTHLIAQRKQCHVPPYRNEATVIMGDVLLLVE